MSIFGNTSMSIYANAKARTRSSTSHTIAVGDRVVARLWLNYWADVADASQDGTLSVIAPPDSGVTFSNCTGIGPAAGALPTCSLTTTSAFNGKWQTVKVPIPDGYTCDDTDPQGCWVPHRGGVRHREHHHGHDDVDGR